MKEKITSFLEKYEMKFVHFVDVSHMDKEATRGFSTAILFGQALTQEYVYEVSQNPNFVEDLKRKKQIQNDQFHLKEIHTDGVADNLAEYIRSLGYSAFSQSEKNLEENRFFDLKNYITPLPHKTIAGMAGLGWIGKHDLLVTDEYGSAISMCTVLTDAPIPAVSGQPIEPLCGDCTICVDLCKVNAIKGQVWSSSTSRDQIVDVSKCDPCIQCMIQCPFTQQYMKKHLIEKV